ncbi:hypothetical protein TPA0910_45630 [Streptomyces hygroscopicus subsp. sporocinereus]|uniref:Uncharacterized protein n=1 Tax=Streptomyces hygroscopicus TaxID=1912 RepID=A0ABQ3U3D7_STRHY|nr:hypothetical protein TPA0910_45630 [Streptomyces hygroscopicus]
MKTAKVMKAVQAVQAVKDRGETGPWDRPGSTVDEARRCRQCWSGSLGCQQFPQALRKYCCGGFSLDEGYDLLKGNAMATDPGLIAETAV